MMESTEKKERKEKKSNDAKGGFTVGDVPLRVMNWFFHDMDSYNDIFWVKIQDLMRKAEAYDMFVSMGIIPEQPVQQKEVQEKNDEGVQTFGGRWK